MDGVHDFVHKAEQLMAKSWQAFVFYAADCCVQRFLHLHCLHLVPKPKTPMLLPWLSKLASPS
jgi:hypothetical protein